MGKKNVVEGNISNSGNIHIGDVITNVIADSIEDKIHLTKAQYRQNTKQKYFELPDFFIQRSLTHLKAILETQKYYYPEKEFRPLRELLSEKQKLVLLGDAGMGKSTELKYLYNNLLDSEDDVFPIWVSLNRHLISESFEVYLSELANIDNAKIVLILDGYDEIPSSDHPLLNRLIANLLSKRNQINILYSSRKNTYDINTTLEGFEIYYLNEIELIDIKKYFSCLGDAVQYSDFEQELKRVNFLDIIKNPFYLNTIIDLYLSENELPDSKSKLMQFCIEKMITLDIKRSNSVAKFDRFEVIKIIKKVALSVEMLCRNVISETDLRKIISTKEYHELKYFGGFKKEDGKNDIWKFDHNNLQEYLAASAISHLSFKQILKIISFEPDYTVLNPSWLNTISYLLSEIDSKETFDKLLSWLKTHNSHFLVNTESNRIQKDIRIEVFKNIFDEYEKNDLPLYSNHFTEQQLVGFVQDIYDVFIFLFEKYTSSNDRKVKINALRLLGFIDYAKYSIDFRTLYYRLVEDINNPEVVINAVILDEIIDCLSRTKMLNEEQIDYIINTVKDDHSYQVINSCVKMIRQSNNVDKFINYLIKAFEYEPTDKVVDIGLEYHLGKAFGEIKTKEGILCLFDRLNDIDWYYENKSSLGFFAKVMENVYNLYKKDDSIFFEIIKLISNPALQDSHYYQIPLLQFFNNTGKRDLAFQELLKLNKQYKVTNDRILGLLITDQTVEAVLEEINSKDYEIDWISHINVSHNDVKDKVFLKIFSKRNFHDNSFGEFIEDQNKYKQNSFNLLFDPQGFKNALDNFIDSYGERNISKDDVDKLIDLNFRDKHKFRIPDDVISLLQILVRKYGEISVLQFKELANDEEKISIFRITKIRELIYNNNWLKIEVKQIDYLNSWVLGLFSRKVFDKLNSNVKACVVDFSVRFDFHLPLDILIQLLPFESYIPNMDTCFNWLKNKMTRNDLETNIIGLLNTDQSLPDRVLLNYFKYLNENKVKNINHYILEPIKNTSFDQHYRISFINEYLKSDGSLRALKDLYNDNDKDIKWHLLECFIEKGEKDFVLGKLKYNMSNVLLSKEDRFETIKLLVKMEQDVGFVLYLSEVCDSNVAKIQHRDVIKDIRKPESISFLFSLLELCLKNQNKVDVFDRTTSEVTGVIENIALDSDNNFIRINKEYENLCFIRPEDKPYIISLMAGLKDRFYRNKSQKRTIPEVNQLLQELNL